MRVGNPRVSVWRCSHRHLVGPVAMSWGSRDSNAKVCSMLQSQADGGFLDFRDDTDWAATSGEIPQRRLICFQGMLPYLKWWHIMARPFTKRQLQILELRLAGLTCKEVATRLGLVEGTVKVYISKAADRAGLRGSALLSEMFRRQRVDYMRLKAITLSEWLKEYGEYTPPLARQAMEGIMAGMVFEAVPGKVQA